MGRECRQPRRVLDGESPGERAYRREGGAHVQVREFIGRWIEGQRGILPTDPQRLPASFPKHPGGWTSALLLTTNASDTGRLCDPILSLVYPGMVMAEP